MCRGYEQQYERERERARLKMKGFYLRLSLSKTPITRKTSLPDSLTLYYLPRISGSPLDVDGSNIRPDSPAFITLHRLVSSSELVYGSRECVRASEGVRFEVLLRDEKLLKGIFRRDDEFKWKLECKCALERDHSSAHLHIKEAEVCVAVEGQAMMISQTVEMAVNRKRKGKCFQQLEVIPEEREVEDDDDDSSCLCSCSCSTSSSSCGSWSYQDDNNSEEEEEDMQMMEMDKEGVRWAVDMGIWVMCFGVAFFVSKASYNTLRPLRRLL